MTQERGRVSDEAVKKATGKAWNQWFALLDKAGAKKMNHTEIAHWLSTQHIPSGWWAQMVTVEFERAQGKRKVNENAEGFLVSVHKTVELSLNRLEKEWLALLHSRALSHKHLMPLPSNTKRRMLRYKADVGEVIVFFDERGKGGSRIMVESVKLPSKKMVELNRAFWKKVLANIG